MSRYKGYNPEWGKKATLKYIKENQHRVEISWKKEYYINYIEPAIKESGLPVATYIKQAVEEKIEKNKRTE